MTEAPRNIDARSGEQTASKALIGAAVIHLLPGLLFWRVAGIKFDVNDWVRIGGFLLLLAIGFWARRAPLPPAALCLVLYLAFLGLQVYQRADWAPHALGRARAGCFAIGYRARRRC